MYDSVAKNFTDFVVKFCGGPDNYEGRTLLEIHRKMNLPPAIF